MEVDKNIRILVVDDSVAMRSLFIHLLQQAKFTNIRQSDDGANAWEVLQKEPVDFIISDWNMKKMSGLDLLMKLRGDDRFRHLPFLLVTTENDKKNVIMAIKEGVSGYIVKPPTLDALTAKINSIMEKQQSISTEKAVPEQPKPSLKKIIQVSPELKDLVPSFLITTSMEISTLESTVLNAPYKEIERIGSSIKGSAASYGFQEMAALAGSIIDSTKKNTNRLQIKEIITKLHNHFGNLEVVSVDKDGKTVKIFSAGDQEKKPEAPTKT